MYLSVDTSLAPSPQKNSSGANDVISTFVHMLSFECDVILRTFRGSLLWTVADKLLIKFEVSVNGI